MAEKYDEKEIKRRLPETDKTADRKKDERSPRWNRQHPADCIPDHGYGRLIGGAQRCLCHLLQRSEDHAGRSGRNH